ncbi:hypothetical protein AVEN_106245-1 [Araneus ventricosus]|uniref:Uncharacterized protein n=1 Tax=Araneus ventricosus TaxID=182803 RepID=A0A4Y2HI07_ARAVE|nr:hypothetical protein AVEN_106245-1 [Araneus ventricosus]
MQKISRNGSVVPVSRSANAAPKVLLRSIVSSQNPTDGARCGLTGIESENFNQYSCHPISRFNFLGFFHVVLCEILRVSDALRKLAQGI